MRPALFLCVVACWTAPAAAQTAPALSGTWTVDLTTQPGAPYLKTMVLQLAENGTVTGSFYDSVIEGGQWKTARGRTCVSFRTTDGKGPYHSAACLRGDMIEGQTWAEHRGFLFNWNATRAR